MTKQKSGCWIYQQCWTTVCVAWLGWFCFPSDSWMCSAQDAKPFTKVADGNWLETVEPGVQLIGRPKTISHYLDSGCFTMSLDGQLLVGARGRELCVIDWDRQELLQSVKMPFQVGSTRIIKFQFSADENYLLVWLNWSGRPFELVQEDELDEYANYLFNAEFPSESFYGDRLLVYDSDLRLMHDIELTYDPDRIQNPGTPVFYGVSDIYATASDDLAVAIASPTSRVIDLKRGKVLHERALLSWNAVPIQGRIFSVRPEKAYIVEQWWDPVTNTVSTDEESILSNFAASPMLVRPLQVGQYFTVVDRQRSVLSVNSPDGETTIEIPGRNWYNNRAGNYSQDGRYFIIQSEYEIALVDLRNQEVRFQFRSPRPFAFGAMFFRPHHETLIVKCGPQLAEIAIDDDFETNLRAFANMLPNGGELAFGNNDNVLTIGQKVVLNLQDGTANRFDLDNPYSHSFHQKAVSPVASLCVHATFDELVGLGEKIEIGPLETRDMKLMYTNHPSFSPAILRVLTGFSTLEEECEDDKWIGAFSSHLSFSSDGEVLRNVYIDSARCIRLRLTHKATRKLIKDIALDSAMVVGEATVSPDGKRAVVFRERELEVFDTENGRLIQNLTLPKHVYEARFDERGDLLAVRMAQGTWTLQVIDLDSEQTVFQEDGLHTLGYGFRSGSNEFYLATHEKKENRLRLFDRETWEVSWEHATNYGEAYSMAMSHDGSQAAFGLNSCHIELWQLRDIQRHRESSID